MQEAKIALRLFIATLALVTLGASASASVAATSSELLTTFGTVGAGAGQMRGPNALAASPATGHTFSVDAENYRIDEFSAWGNFVKAFGWDVAPGAVNEQQEITIKATAGQFRLGFGTATTGDLEWDSPPSAVQDALNALPPLSTGSVSVVAGPRDDASTRFVVSFSGGALSATDVAEMTATGGTVPLSGGGAPSVSVATRADGTPGGTGLESCTAESGCKAGSRGFGPGQVGLTFPGAAVDSNGDIYVSEIFEGFNQRVQKFDPAGRFIWAIGGEVDKTSGANLCTAASGHTCGNGIAGSGPGEFTSVRDVKVDPLNNNILVADGERIQKFHPDGEFSTAITVPGSPLKSLAVGPSSGELYVIGTGESAFHVLSSSGKEICRVAMPVGESGRSPVLDSIAVDPSGTVYANSSQAVDFPLDNLYVFAKGCSSNQPLEFDLGERSEALGIRSLATNTVGDLLLSRAGGGAAYIRLYGPPPINFEPPPTVPPTIIAQYQTSVGSGDATVHADINSHFWTDTRYYVEYGTGMCSAGGCDQTAPPPPGVILSKSVSGSAVASRGVLLSGLQPGVIYHYRFVAQGGGGGPVRGIGGDPGTDGAENTLRTSPLPNVVEGCPNQAFRTGPSAALPNCRAYEMVSPVDKNNGDIRDLINVTGFPQGIRQSAPDGDSMAYSSYRAFSDPISGPISIQYLARRGSAGWSSQGLAHPRVGESVLGGVAATEPEFKVFSEDLCSAWVVDASSLPYAPGALENFPNLYRRDNCPGSYEALTTAQPSDPLPPNTFTIDQAPELQGFSANGRKAVFMLPFKLTDDAVEGAEQAYEASEGRVSLLCVLPSGAPLGRGCAAGTRAAPVYINRGSSLKHAISDDGSRVYWTDQGRGPGQIYLRLNGATTLPVSGTQSTAKSQFWGASADGSSALFAVTEKTKAGKLYQYSLESEASVEIAGEVVGVAGASDDLSYVYFASREAIGGPNSEGKSATAGQPNLYLYHDGIRTFVATLTESDVDTSLSYSNVATQPIYHVARATADGRHLVFISNNPLTGADNTDVKSGEADVQVFQYEAEGQLNCISCNPGGARPQGRVIQAPAGEILAVAGLVSAPLTQLYTPRAQTEDGNRVFFESYDALVARDTNGRVDVYEWERAGAGSCSESTPSYSPLNGGCVYLISNGTSPFDAEFVDASSDGEDVFFTTDASLLPQDPGLIDLYDARVGGGFAPAPGPPAACEGEACQGPLSPPNDPTPSSSTFKGAGNVVEKPARKKHKKKKHAKKKQHAKKQHAKKRADNNRRAQR
jgi:hypothetical protein